MNEFKKALEATGGLWTDGKDAAPGVPDGVYTLQLVGCKIAVSQTSGNPMIKRSHLVLEGEHEGTTIYDNLVMASEQNMYFVARFIELMDYELPDDVCDIEGIVDELNGANPTYTARVKKSGDFTNVNVQELLEGTSETDTTKPGHTEVEEAGDDAPGGIDEGALVKFAGGDDTLPGEVVGFEDTNAVVKDADGCEWTVDVEDLTVIDEDEYNELLGGDEAPPEPDAPGEEEDPDCGLLVDFANAFNVADDATADLAKADLVSRLNEYTWGEDTLTPDEADLLKRNGVDVTPAKPKPAPKKAATARKKSVKNSAGAAKKKGATKNSAGAAKKKGATKKKK